MKLFIFACSLFLSPLSLWASSPFPAQLSFLTGNISTSFSESESNLVSTDGTTTTKDTPYSGSATTMPMIVSYEFFSTLKRSYFISGGGPLMASTPDRIFYINGGMNFYLNKSGTTINITTPQLSYYSTSSFRYYLGFDLGTTYLIYNTKSQTKNDLLLELGGHTGSIYNLNERWGIKGELSFSRYIGALVTGSTIKILIGANYNLL